MPLCSQCQVVHVRVQAVDHVCERHMPHRLPPRPSQECSSRAQLPYMHPANHDPHCMSFNHRSQPSAIILLHVFAMQGHFQVVFSKEHCPLRKRKLSWFMRVRCLKNQITHQPSLLCAHRWRCV